MRSSRLLSAGLVLGLLATACTDDTSMTQPATTDRTITIEPGEITLTGGLAAFDNCDTLLTHLRTEGAARVGPYGLELGNWYGPVFATDDVGGDFPTVEADGASDGGNSAPPTPAANIDRTEGADFSSTNNQERGVDEPDIVKTDGNRILTITNGSFTYIDVADGTPTKRGTIEVGLGASNMVVDGDRVLIFGSSGGYWGGPFPGPIPLPATDVDVATRADVEAIDRSAVDSSTESTKSEVDDAEAQFAEAPPAEVTAEGIAEGEFYPTEPGWAQPRARIVQLDISNPDRLVQLGELLLEGTHLSARLVDGTARIAIQSNPANLPFVYPSNLSSEAKAEEFNRQVVAETTIDDWLPDFEFMVEGETASTGQVAACADVHAPAEFAGFGSLSVISIDPQAPLDSVAASSVLAAGETVYASTDTMWLATSKWVDWEALDDSQVREFQTSYSTQLHGFDITGSNAEYLASGDVRGHMLNQFSLSEYEGVLRVATTDGTPWGVESTSESFITTFDVVDRELRQLGQVGDMGRGERIFSVRFMGDVAYVVTFRQTDPFYTVDLSDPSRPAVLGELKINGYSGQLHPIGENRILGIGQDATIDGRTTGAKLTVFDVTDLASPTALDTWTLPDSWTDAEWNHLSFLWWAPENLAVIPIASWQQRFWGAVAFRIDPGTGVITEAGRLSHEPDPDRAVGTTECRIVDAADLEAYRNGRGELAGLAEEAFAITEEGGQVQLCDEGDSGAAGLSCERLDWLDASDVGAAGTFEICWPQGPAGDPIMRTLVTNADTLWTLSSSRLQANNLETLEPGTNITLP